MGAEGHPQIREAEIDPLVDFRAVAKSFSDNIRALSELANSRRLHGGTLPPEEQARLDALQDGIANVHVQSL